MLEAAGAPAQQVIGLGGMLARGLLSLALVLALLWALAWLWRRMGHRRMGNGAGDGIVVETQRAVGRQSWILLVRVGSRRLLVGVTPQRISRLAAWREAGVEAAPAAFPEAVEQRLQRLRELVTAEGSRDAS
jgi:flagellar protein FliO/FliZ